MARQLQIVLTLPPEYMEGKESMSDQEVIEYYNKFYLDPEMLEEDDDNGFPHGLYEAMDEYLEDADIVFAVIETEEMSDEEFIARAVEHDAQVNILEAYPKEDDL